MPSFTRGSTLARRCGPCSNERLKKSDYREAHIAKKTSIKEPQIDTAAPFRPPFFGAKVVTAEEMARVEKLARESGCSEEEFIVAAGKRVALAAMEYPMKSAVLLIGKGSKGADAYAAGCVLAENGILVRAFALFPPDQCGRWNRLFGERFGKKEKIVAIWNREEMRFEEDLIIDGIFGTGFRGEVAGIAEGAIRAANDSGKPILAIDLPSGLDGTTGHIRGAGIAADATVSLGFAKIGCFLREGWNAAGRIRVEEFGLPARFLGLAKEVAYLPDPMRLPLPKLVRNRHKYQAGYVIGFSGSKKMRGAPKLAGLAALRAGAGIVRIFSKGDIGEAPAELICQKWEASAWTRELQRAKAVFAGPGLGAGLADEMEKIALPMVLDADALQKAMRLPKHAILTPHRQEMLRLLGLAAAPEEEEFLARCQRFVARNRVVLILKGAPTFLFCHGLAPLIIPRGDPGMATAGAGDVLTGIVAALLAQGMGSYEAAAAGAYLHALAGEHGARKKTSYGLIASDLIDCLPEAFSALMAARCCKTAGSEI